MKKTFKCYSDPGHGWIAVKRSLLHSLGIAEKISSFSYERGATVYLEEDSDASTFVAAYKEATGELPELPTAYTNKSSPIRSYAPYRFRKATND